VLVLTGAGLKDPISALKILPSPPSAEPSYNAVSKFLNYGYYNVHAAHKSSKDVLFKHIPSASRLKKLIKENFDLELSKEDLNACVSSLVGFEEKGKGVTHSDLQLVLKNILKRHSIRKKALQVVDFKVLSGKHSKSQGLIKANYLGKKITQKAYGVGPVDAIINAITKSLSNGFNFRLTDYSVDIDSKGTDAVVDVKMTLMDKNKNKVVAIGTSPDIIVASIEAFEEGYNILYSKNKR